MATIEWGHDDHVESSFWNSQFLIRYNAMCNVSEYDMHAIYFLTHEILPIVEIFVEKHK
jgi:hypothetical protein